MRASARAFILVISCSFLGIPPAAAQAPSIYYGLVYAQPDHGRADCKADYRLLRNAEISLHTGGTKESRSFLQDARKQAGSSFRQFTFKGGLFSPAQALLVWSYRYTEGKCSYRVIAHEVGADLATVRRSLAAKPAMCRQCSDYKELVAWPTRPSAEGLTRNYGGLEVTFTTRRTDSGKSVVLVEGRNVHRDSTAVLVITSRGKHVRQPIVLRPGESFKGPFDSVDDFQVEVQFRAPEDPSAGLIDALKSVIREHLIREGGAGRDGRIVPGKRG